MPNGATLRDWKGRGAKTVYFASIAIFIEAFLALALGSLYGADGLAVVLTLVIVTLLVVVFSLQQQIDAIDGALRGVRDESDYSQRIVAHLADAIRKKG